MNLLELDATFGVIVDGRQLRFASIENKRYAMIMLQRRRTHAGGITPILQRTVAVVLSRVRLGHAHRHTASKTRYTREKVVSPFALSNPPAM